MQSWSYAVYAVMESKLRRFEYDRFQNDTLKTEKSGCD